MVLPYGLMPPTIVLLSYVYYHPHAPWMTAGVHAGAALLLVLLFLRQLLAISENVRLNQDLQQSAGQLEAGNRSLTDVNATLRTSEERFRIAAASRRRRDLRVGDRRRHDPLVRRHRRAARPRPRRLPPHARGVDGGASPRRPRPRHRRPAAPTRKTASPTRSSTASPAATATGSTGPTRAPPSATPAAQACR